MKDPISKCKCIPVSEFIDLYQHSGKDKDCKPCDGDGGNANEFNFNFYGPVYSVNGISNDQEIQVNSNDQKECEKCETKTETTDETLTWDERHKVCTKTFNEVTTKFDEWGE